MGIESEDGTVTGSIDVNQLDQIEPKTDEAKAQIAALKAEVAQGQEQTQADAARLAEQAEAQNPTAEVAADNRDAQGVPAQPEQADQSQPEGQPEQPSQAEQAGLVEPQPDQSEQAKASRRRGI